jgi:Rrf2 family protein
MLALTKKTSYGLAAMAHMATLDGQRVTCAREIASLFGVPPGLLMNVLKELAASGYVESIRGAHGGYRLARRPKEISLADVVTALEGPIRSSQCISGQVNEEANSTCDDIDRCPVASPIHRVHRKLRDFLKTVTLADIVGPAAVAVQKPEQGTEGPPGCP